MQRLCLSAGRALLLESRRRWASQRMYTPAASLQARYSATHNGVRTAPPTSGSADMTSHSTAAGLRLSHNAVGVSSHAGMLISTAESATSPALKRRRARGVVKKLEENHITWLAALTTEATAERQGRDCANLLIGLASVHRFLENNRASRHGGGSDGVARHFVPAEEADSEWTGVSPYFSASLSDALALCLRIAAAEARESPEQLRKLLECAVALEIGDADAFHRIVSVLTSKDYCAQCATTELVETLRLLSLAVKRCKLQPPPLDYIFSRLPAERDMSPRDALHVLSSLVRLRQIQRAVVVGSGVSRNAVDGVAQYSTKDVVYGLEAIGILNVCHEAYAAAVLDRTAELAPTMSPKEVGDVCKYIGLLQPHRHTDSVALSCSRELRRVLPALERRAEELLGKFSLRDARYVLRCFSQHKVRHSILFARLTPHAGDE